MFVKELASNILKVIDENNMTLESLSEKSGLSRRFINNIISGKQVPTINSLEKLCSALELEPNDLLINCKSKDKDRSVAMYVNTVYCNKRENIYTYTPICPYCNSLLQNHWQSYCDNCGQKLSWKHLINSNVIMKKPQKNFKD
ncbi:MAG: helix-turn-helix transcriptional regulator [Ruminococcaceae bacterium]|nr:helix-turn-helix transcriptional regulator [Oscillospiraceae bacterium]